MYIDPLNGEGLFPIDEEGTISERELPFEFKQGEDYFSKFDAILPKWTLFPYEDVKGSECAFSDATGAAEVRIAPRTTRVVSYRRYVRAIDPAGNLCQLIVSTVRPSPYYKDGNDKCGTLNRVVAAKNQAGWIIVENNPMFWNPYSGKAGQQYAAWALAVMAHRQKMHAAHEKREAL